MIFSKREYNMFDPEKTDPYYLMAYHTSGLKEVCSYLLYNEKVDPNKEGTIKFYHHQVSGIYLMLNKMKQIIDLHNDWNTDFGEDRED